MEKEIENEPEQADRRIDIVERPDGQEKRTRFSLSHDDGSIGNNNYISTLSQLHPDIFNMLAEVTTDTC